MMGVYQSTSSLGRFCGQTLSGTLYGQVGPNAPFALGALAMIPAFVIAVVIGRRLHAEKAAAPAADGALALDGEVTAGSVAGPRTGRQ